jgi:uncharacterized protein YbjT (DUF2867 family)
MIRKTNMIAVFGATGQTGSEVTRQLAAQGVPTRALVRNPEKGRLLEGLGVEIVQADLEQPDTLEAALAGAERAYFTTSGEATQSSPNFYAAAKRAGVKHIVRTSGSFMVREPHGIRFDEWHHQAELALEASGLDWTHLRPSYFMQNLLLQGASGTLALPFASRLVNLVDVRDIAAVAVVALTGQGHAGQVYDITGPESLTFYAVAAQLTEVTGRAFTYTPVSRAEFKTVLQQWGLPDTIASDLANEYGEIGDGHPAFSAARDTVPRLTGKPARSLRDFAHDYATQLTTPPQWRFDQA